MRQAMQLARGLALAFTITATTWPAVAPAQAPARDDRPTVAVMHFVNGAIGRWHEEYDALRVGIPDLLVTELASNPAVRVLERDQVAQVLREQDLNASDRVEKETAVRIGRLLGVHHMIFGTFVIDARGAMRIDVRAVNTETSEIEYIETVRERSDDFMVAIARLAEKMNAGMKLPPVPREVRETRSEKAKDVPFRAALLYARAVAEETNGQWERAAKQYRAVLAEFPDYEPAQKALARTKKGA